VERVLAGATIHPQAKTQAFENLKLAEMWIVMMRHQHESVAKRTILDTLASAETLRHKVDKLTNLPVYPLLRPMLKGFLKLGAACASPSGRTA
jgi:hypothetical protein